MLKSYWFSTRLVAVSFVICCFDPLCMLPYIFVTSEEWFLDYNFVTTNGSKLSLHYS